MSASENIPVQPSHEIPDKLYFRIGEVARLAGIRGVARIDFLSDGRDLFVNEVNTVPGSLARYLWVEPAVPFLDLLDAMVDEVRAGR